MKFNCLKEDLVETLDVVIKASEPKPQKPQLAGFYLKLAGNTLHIHANNYTLGIKAKIPVDGQGDGVAVVNAAKMLAVAKSMPSNTIKFEFDEKENLIDVMGGKTKISLVTIAKPDEFPLVNDDAGEDIFTIIYQKLYVLIMQTVVARAEGNDTQPIYTSCHIELDGSDINFVATDKHRLAVNSRYLVNKGNANLNVPAEQLAMIAPYFCSNADVTVKSDGKSISIVKDNFLFKLRVIDGDFPQWRNVIPEGNPIKVEVESRDLLATLKRAMLVARDDFNKKIELVADEGLMVRARAAESGLFEEIVNAKVSGGSVTAAFKINHLIDGLKQPGGKYTLHLSDDNHKPMLMTTAEDKNFKYVASPLR